MRYRILLALLVLAGSSSSQQPKDILVLEKDMPQVRELPKEGPEAVVVETGRLAYFVSRLSSKGLLTEQTGDAVGHLLGQAGNASIVKLRAFVAGSGDTRRVRTVVSEMFTARHLALPALTVVHAGALPSTGVQIVIEATGVARNTLNPQGLAFLSAQESQAEGLPLRAAPLVARAAQKLKSELAAAGMDARDVVRATCFVSSLEDYAESRRALAAEFPKAVQNFVQPLRAPAHGSAACEAVARLRTAGGEALQVVEGSGDSSSSFSRLALVRAPRIVLTGSQIAFGYRDEDARLAFQRLGKIVEDNGGSLGEAAWMSIYALSDRLEEQAGRLKIEFLAKGKFPAGTALVCEDLPALDASFAADVVTVYTRSR